MHWKPEKVTYGIDFQTLLGFHFKDGQNFELPKSLDSVQNRISAAWSSSKSHNF
jgi:hypothetical protein